MVILIFISFILSEYKLKKDNVRQGAFLAFVVINS